MDRTMNQDRGPDWIALELDWLMMGQDSLINVMDPESGLLDVWSQDSLQYPVALTSLVKTYVILYDGPSLLYPNFIAVIEFMTISVVIANS